MEGKERTMEGVGARFCDRADDGTGRASVFGRVVVDNDLEFFNGFRSDVGTGSSLRVAGMIRIGDPVQEELIGGPSPSPPR